MGKRKSIRNSRGVLIIVALLLVASAGVRFGGGPGMAIALSMAQADEPTVSPQPTVEDISPQLVAILNDLRGREELVLRRETEIDSRFQALSLVEAEVEKDIARLEKAEAKLRATMSAANQAAETDIARLTAVYENMKAEQAASLFQRMEPSFAAGFLGRMRPDAAASIMAGLEPDLAYSISVVLAGRNADVPVEPEGNTQTDGG